MKLPMRIAAVSLAAAIGCVTVGIWAAPAPTVKLEFRRAEDKPGDGLKEAVVRGVSQKIYLHKAAEVTNEDITDARVVFDGDDTYGVEITFSKEGGEKMAKLTQAHKGKPLAILIDGKVIAAPLVTEVIREGAVISAKFTKEETDRIVKGMKGK